MLGHVFIEPAVGVETAAAVRAVVLGVKFVFVAEHGRWGAGGLKGREKYLGADVIFFGARVRQATIDLVVTKLFDEVGDTLFNFRIEVGF